MKKKIYTFIIFQAGPEPIQKSQDKKKCNAKKKPYPNTNTAAPSPSHISLGQTPLGRKSKTKKGKIKIKKNHLDLLRGAERHPPSCASAAHRSLPPRAHLPRPARPSLNARRRNGRPSFVCVATRYLAPRTHCLPAVTPPPSSPFAAFKPPSSSIVRRSLPVAISGDSTTVASLFAFGLLEIICEDRLQSFSGQCKQGLFTLQGKDSIGHCSGRKHVNILRKELCKKFIFHYHLELLYGRLCANLFYSFVFHLNLVSNT